jgi:hypothetical protein
MNLEKWVEYGWLKAEATSRDEIKGLLAIVDRDLKDASVTAISDDRRFEAAFNAARSLANVALRGSGYRTSTQPGHHLKTIESLELTIQAAPNLVQRLKVFSKKRNATNYDAAGSVSVQELELAMKTAVELQETVVAWLEKHHSELVKD